jgi:hypothetical protein
MARSEESKAKRLEYTRQWRKQQRGIDYHAQWRKDHAHAEAARMRVWREHNRDLVRAQRMRWYRKHPRVRREEPAIPSKFHGHDFFDTARFICGSEPYFDWGLGWEEAMADVVLALVEGRDPNAAAVASWQREKGWRAGTGPLFQNVDVRDHDRRVVFVSAHED